MMGNASGDMVLRFYMDYRERKRRVLWVGRNVVERERQRRGK